jgi:DNA mismatch endonuclease, patch repair protein
MRAVARRNTSAEKVFQAALRKLGLRFQTHIPLRGCQPDVLFERARTVVFVDGDFWHGRLLVELGPTALKQSLRTNNRAFWIAKITRNVARDRLYTFRLRRHGWSVLRVWERDVLRDPWSAAALVAKRVSERRRRGHGSSGV